MKRSLTAPAVVLVILLVAGVLVAGVGLGTDGATAITVGDQRLSKEALNDELRDWAQVPSVQAQSTVGAVTGTAGAGITTQAVYRLLADSYLERTGEQVTAADRARVRAAVVGTPEFRSAPRSFRKRYLETVSTIAALSRLVGTDDQLTSESRVLRREARRVEVSVSPAYGRFAPARVQVVPYPTPFTPAPG